MSLFLVTIIFVVFVVLIGVISCLFIGPTDMDEN